MSDEDGRAQDGQIYVDREKFDVDPSEGLLSGTAIDGTSDIPGSEGSGVRQDAAPADGGGEGGPPGAVS